MGHPVTVCPDTMSTSNIIQTEKIVCVCVLLKTINKGVHKFERVAYDSIWRKEGEQRNNTTSKIK